MKTKADVSSVLKPSNYLRKPEEYQKFLDWICQSSKKKITITQLAKDLGITRETVYQWARLPHTKHKQNEYFKSLTALDRKRMYENVINLAEKNPRSQRLYYEYYENWQGSQPQHGNIQVNILIDNKKEVKEKVKKADFEEIE